MSLSDSRFSDIHCNNSSAKSSSGISEGFAPHVGDCNQAVVIRLQLLRKVERAFGSCSLGSSDAVELMPITTVMFDNANIRPHENY